MDYESKKFLEIALKEAKKAEKKDEVPIGAVIVKDNKIISKAHNLKEKKQNAILHAEMIVIEKASKKLGSWRLNDCTLYVTLEPCIMCASALVQSRIKKVVFGAYDKKAGALSLGFNLHQNPKLNHQYEMEFLDFPECSKILTQFFKAKRNL
jgi:tRNA(adenine34) deaminase